MAPADLDLWCGPLISTTAAVMRRIGTRVSLQNRELMLHEGADELVARVDRRALPACEAPQAEVSASPSARSGMAQGRRSDGALWQAIVCL